MSSRTLPGFGLEGFAPYGEDGYNTWLDENLKRLSATGAQMRVLSRTTSLPGSPTQGNIYIIPPGDTNGNKVAVYDAGAWAIYTPQAGWRTWVADEAGFAFWNGTAWLADNPGSTAPTHYFTTRAALAATTFTTPPDSVVVGSDGAGAGPFGYRKALTEPTHGGKTQSADGTWYELLTPQVTEALAGSTAAMNAFVGEMLTRPPSYGRIVNPAGGLRISDFATTTSPSIDQLAVLQAAVAKLNTGSAYNVLDLEGRTLSISDTLVIDDNQGLFAKPKIICNGALAPMSTFPGGKPLIEFRRSGGGTLQQWELDHIFFKCGGSPTNVQAGIDAAVLAGDATGRSAKGWASAVLIVPTYNTMRFTHCHVTDPCGLPNPIVAADGYGYGIKTLVAGGNTRIEFCDIRKSSEAAVTPSSRTMIGIWLAPDSNDGKIIGNRITYARTALRGNINSFTIIANHFWQGPTGTGPFTDYTETFLIGGRSHNLVIGNYIDNGKFILQEGLDSAPEFSDDFMGYGQWIGNIFTVAENASTYSFMVLRPKGAARKVRDMVVMGNQFRSLGGVNETVQKPFAVDTSLGGNIDTSYSVGNCIKDNNFRVKVVPQETEIERHITLGGGITSWALDFTGFTPFGLRMENPKSAPGIRYNSDPGTDPAWRYIRVSAYTGTLRITPAAGGHAVLTMTCNTGSTYDSALGSF